MHVLQVLVNMRKKVTGEIVMSLQEIRFLCFKAKGCTNEEILAELRHIKKICGKGNLFKIVEEKDGAYRLLHTDTNYITRHFWNGKRMKIPKAKTRRMWNGKRN